MAGTDDDDRRRRALGWLVPAVSLALGVALTLWVGRTMGGYAGTLQKVRTDELGEVVEVPVLAQTLGRGTVVAAEDLVVLAIASEYLAPTVVRDRKDLVGRTLGARVLAGEPVRAERLVDPGLGNGLDALVTAGMRAVSLDLPPQRTVSGFVNPGDRVDLVVTLPPVDDDSDVRETKTLAVDLEVLAVDERVSVTAEGDPAVRDQLTVLVAPALAEKLAHVAEFGWITVSLRSQLDGLDRASPRAPPSPGLGRPSRRMSPAAFRDAFTFADIDAMYARLAPPPPEPLAVNPHLLRDLDPPRSPPKDVTTDEPTPDGSVAK